MEAICAIKAIKSLGLHPKPMPWIYFGRQLNVLGIELRWSMIQWFWSLVHRYGPVLSIYLEIKRELRKEKLNKSLFLASFNKIIIRCFSLSSPTKNSREFPKWKGLVRWENLFHVDGRQGKFSNLHKSLY